MCASFPCTLSPLFPFLFSIFMVHQSWCLPHPSSKHVSPQYLAFLHPEHLCRYLLPYPQFQHSGRSEPYPVFFFESLFLKMDIFSFQYHFMYKNFDSNCRALVVGTISPHQSFSFTWVNPFFIFSSSSLISFLITFSVWKSSHNKEMYQFHSS